MKVSSMKNKIELKKCLLGMGFTILLFVILAGILHVREWYAYQEEYNRVLIQIFERVKKEYPQMTEKEWMEILNGQDKDSKKEANDSQLMDTGEEESSQQFLKKYGISMAEDALLAKNEKNKNRYFLLWLSLILLLGISISFLFLYYNRKKDRELEEITEYLERINQKNYSIELESMTEDELSMLKTELYKTTIMLKEAEENSRKDKENLKDAMSDISHQMKTPLTSVLVILDNLIDDSEMDPVVRQDFIRDIKREISHMQFLVQALLKMTKLDTGTVTFLREQVRLSSICQEAIKNVSLLCELKNIQIVTNFAKEDRIYCDSHWQIEAITNILKNCAEHGPEGSQLVIKTEKNPVYGAISITDFGPGIDKEDQKHLFERFYRGKNNTSDGVGIGLSLAKTIVEQDQGKIFVDSEGGQTTFTIKYF